MTTFNLTRFTQLAAIALLIGIAQLANAQSRITAFGSVGLTDIQVSGLGILDLVDPYIKPITQYTTGIQYERELNPHLSFVTGAQYTSRGFAAKEVFLSKIIF